MPDCQEGDAIIPIHHPSLGTPTTPLPLGAAADKSQERCRGVIRQDELGDGHPSHLVHKLRGSTVHRLGHDGGVAHDLPKRGIGPCDGEEGHRSRGVGGADFEQPLTSLRSSTTHISQVLDPVFVHVIFLMHTGVVIV